MAEVRELRIPSFRGRRLLLVSLVIALLGAVGTVVGYLASPGRVLFAWLAAYSFVVSVALGALIFLMANYAIGAGWPIVLRRLIEGVIGAFPLLALGFVPIALGAAWIYPWINPPAGMDPHVLHLIEHKRAYLNVPGFIIRAVVYFAVWIAAAVLLRRWSFRGDGETRTDHALERGFSAAMLPAIGLTLTFASFDWLMSLQPEWYSTIFGVYWFSGGFVAAIGLVTILAFAARRANLVEDAIRPPHFHALGRLLLSFTIFWAYIAYFQAMLIQIADKPEEVTFYLHRLGGGWSVVAVLLLFGRFILPFFLLLPRAVKFRPGFMAAAGAWILAFHYLDCLWLVAPVSPHHPLIPGLIDLAALAALGGATVAFAVWRLRGRPLLAMRDPRLGEALVYRSPL